MKKLFTLMTLFATTVPAFASEDLAARISALEANQAELYHTLAEKKEPANLTAIAERISLSALLEVEATTQSLKLQGGETASTSELSLATAQLGFGFTPLEQASFDISLLYEGEGSDLEVDEAFVELHGGALSARVGQLYLPFGVYSSHFVSDPLVLELGETRETAVVGTLDVTPVTLSLFAFNGSSERLGDREDHLRDWGASIEAAPTDGLTLGAGYLSDLADSDADLLLDEMSNPDNLYTSRVAGWTAFVALEFGPFGLSLEGLGAVERFHVDDLDSDGDGKGDQPYAYNLEVYRQFGDQLELAARYEESHELTSQPKRQYGMCGSWGVQENLSVSLEYLYGEFEQGFAPDDEDTRHLTTLQLALAI